MLARKRSAIAFFIVVIVLILTGCVVQQPQMMTVVVTPTLPGGSRSATPPAGEGHTVPQLPIALEGVAVTDTVTISVTVSGQGHYLFDTPTLQGEPAAPGSVEQARFDVLECSHFSLVFPRPDQEPPWVLIFNPEHEPGNYVAPRAEIEVNP